MPTVAFGHGHEPANEARLIDPAGLRGFALSAFAGPAGFADKDVLRREARAEHPAHIGNVGQGFVDATRVVFPVRQQVDSQKIHRRRHLRVLQPEFPHIGVGHRHLDLVFHPGDQRGQVRAGHFLAQQRLVADDHRADHVGVGIGGGDQQLDFFLCVGRVGVDPGTQHHLQAMLARQRRDCLKTGLGIGTDALETLGQQCQVGVHAGRTQAQRLVVGRLVLVERGVRGALQLVRRAGRVGQVHRLAKPVPQASEPEYGEQACKQVQRQQQAGRTGHRAVHRQAQKGR